MTGQKILKLKALSADFNIDKLTLRLMKSIARHFTNALQELANVYPNSAQDILLITSEGNLSHATLQIMDGLGREVLSSSPSSTSGIDVANLKPGLYFLVLTKNGVKATKKFIKG